MTCPDCERYRAALERLIELAAQLDKESWNSTASSPWKPEYEDEAIAAARQALAPDPVRPASEPDNV